MVFQQARRSLKVLTALGEDVVQLVAFSGVEAISELFHFELELVSMDTAIRPTDVIGHDITFSTEMPDGEQRYFNGCVSKFVAGEENRRERREYSATVVPHLWFLTQSVDSRIFQDQSVTEIIQSVFARRGIADFEMNLQIPRAKREYCVQYQESDFDFVSRLMEEEGIFYYFRHMNGKHMLVLGDSAAAWHECAEAEVDFPMSEQRSIHVRPHITAWEHAWSFHSGAVAHSDFNYLTPNHNLLTGENSIKELHNIATYEQFEFPGGYLDRGAGRELARVRMEEVEARQDLVIGSSSCRSFTPGGSFRVRRHRSHSEEGKEYVLRSVRHEAHEGGYKRDVTGNGKVEYENTFECFPESVAFRPKRVTRRALMRGCQTAKVTGPADEEIYTDEHGRIKVKFHWDRWGTSDEHSSCWIRVSHHHAGSGWGYIDLPRVGEEVVVDFLEGDPDQPLVVGRVYNGLNHPPFALPDEKTRRGYKTKTYKGDGYNELSMDDANGDEEIRIHAQKHMNTVVRSCKSLSVGYNRTSNIGNDDKETVAGNQNGEVGKDRDVFVKENESLVVGGGQIISVHEDQQILVGGHCHLDSGKSITFKAENCIIFETGQSSITMRSNGVIEIRGTDVSVFGNDVSIEASAKLSQEATTIESLANSISSQASVVSIQGGLVKINS